MFENDPSQIPPGNSSHADSLIDALLTQIASTPGGDDEAFLARVEEAMDRDTDTVEEQISRPPFRPFMRRMLVAAAVITFGLSVWFLLSQSTNKNAGPLIIGTTDPSATVPTGPAREETVTAAPTVPVVATNYLIRQQEYVKRADEAALRGSQLMSDGDYQGAIDQYRAALELLPEAPIVEPRRRAYVKQFSRASVLLASQRAGEGRYPETIALIEDVLQPQIDPGSIDAKRLLETLNDPDSYSPALSPSHLEQVRRLKLALKAAQGYLDLGDYNLADREFNKALNDDRYNTAARRGLESNERHKMHYYDAAYDHTRSRLLREVATGWESPVPLGVASSSLDPLSTTLEASTSRYAAITDGTWTSPLETPLSTFSIDVDTASWTNLRAMIRNGSGRDTIPKDAVRIEELINYFPWDYAHPVGEHPFAFATEVGPCPWNTRNRLVRIGIQGREIAPSARPAANLVFLVDVSGSMNQAEKLPLAKRSLALLIETLKEQDRISIVVYAGSEGIALPPTSGREQKTILSSLDQLEAGGSTNGGAGIQLAYHLAREQFINGGINRVILLSDGDFNVGVTGTDSLVDLAEAGAKERIFLSVLGFGQDNLNDAMLEEITNRGNGNYFHIDGFREARKVFLSDLTGTLVTIAKDVKIQVEFNPAEVAAYRLIGYANRKLEDRDFENDEVDAGEVGAGHTVTALYEVVPPGTEKNPATTTPELRYQKTPEQNQRLLVPSNELALVKLRYKQPDRDDSILMTEAITPETLQTNTAGDDFRFASAVALFGMILRDQDGLGEAGLQQVVDLAAGAKGKDPEGYRSEFVDVVRQLLAGEKR